MTCAQKIAIRGMVGICLALSVAAPALTAVTERVSVDSNEKQGNDGSFAPSMSADGRYVAFWSYADNLVPEDTNGVADVFVRDRLTGTTARVSIGSSGTEGNGGSYQAAISGDGRYVAFWSVASNLVADDDNGVADVFVHDRDTSHTELVSVRSDGKQAGKSSFGPSISADGRFVAFWSVANDLEPSDTNQWPDIFVHDRDTGITELIELPESCWAACDLTNRFGNDPAISADGQILTFQSEDIFDLWADIMIHDRLSGATEVVALDYDRAIYDDTYGYSPDVSADGRYVAFNFLGIPAEPDMAIEWGLFVHDRETGLTENVNDVSSAPISSLLISNGSVALNANGRYVTFTSKAQLMPGDTNDAFDVFILDRSSGVIQRISVDSDGIGGNGRSEKSAISANGRYVAFESQASNLVAMDTNGAWDIFVRDREGPNLDDLVALVDSFDLAKGIDKALNQMLENVGNALAADNAAKRGDVANKLNAFIRFVTAQRGRMLTNEQVSQLTEMATDVIQVLEKSLAASAS